MIVSGDPAHGRAIALAAGTNFNVGVDTVLARVDGERLLGGVVYQTYTGPNGSIAMHMAGFTPHWASKDMLWIAFDYPFNQLKCKKIFGTLPSNSIRTLQIDLKLGFREEIRVADVFPDADLIVLSMTRERCRWLDIKPRSVASRR